MEQHLFKTSQISLWELLSNDNQLEKPVTDIEIPVIQRDYAQGRKNDKHINQVRNNLLESLHKALVHNEAIDLDFIYGYCTSERTFIPLDGQQRLTTLFLLHWYVAKHENIPLSKEFCRFSYKTRASSRDFLDKLVKLFSPSFDYGEDKTYQSISDEIVDQYWCERHWTLTDPTIQSMLVMLDDIDQKFSNEYGLWTKLTNKQDNVISFYLLILGDTMDISSFDARKLEEHNHKILTTSEDIYVKMNARGKALTPFEHFKAYLESLLQNVDADLCSKFMNRIDTDWSDMFWNYLSEKEATSGKQIEHSLDNCLLRYYRFIAKMLAYTDPEIDNKDIYDDFQLAKLLFKNNTLAKNHLRYLFDGFDCWFQLCDKTAIYQLFDSLFSKELTQGNKIRLNTDLNLFEKAIWHFDEPRWNYTDAILLWSIIHYLRNGINPSTDMDAKKCLRRIRNLIWTSIGNEVKTESISEIIADVQNILNNPTVPKNSSALNKRLLKEEIEKEQLLANQPDYYPYLCDLEDHRLLSGRIGVIGLQPESFILRATHFLKLFNSDTDDNELITGKKLGQTLSVYGDFTELIKNDRYKMGGRQLANWGELFKNYDKAESTIKPPFVMFLEELTEPMDIFIENKLNSFIDERQCNQDYDWRYYFSRYPEAFDSKSGIYVWSNDYNVRMLDAKQLNGFHRDAYIEMLYSNLRKDIKNEDRWIYGHSDQEERSLKVDTTNIFISFDESSIYLHMRSNAKYYPIFEKYMNQQNFTFNEITKKWNKAIKQSNTDNTLVDKEDRIQAVISIYESILAEIYRD